jgi:hypothetical protein
MSSKGLYFFPGKERAKKKIKHRQRQGKISIEQLKTESQEFNPELKTEALTF